MYQIEIHTILNNLTRLTFLFFLFFFYIFCLLFSLFYVIKSFPVLLIERVSLKLKLVTRIFRSGVSTANKPIYSHTNNILWIWMHGFLYDLPVLAGWVNWGLWRPCPWWCRVLLGSWAPLKGRAMGGYGRGDGWVRLARVGGGFILKCGPCMEGWTPRANGELLPEEDPIMPFWVKKRFSESHNEVKSPGSSAQSQSSAWRMLSSRSDGKSIVHN